MNAVLGYLGAGVNLVKNIALVPLYFSHMGVGTYGAWLASGGVIALLGMLESGLGLVVGQKTAHAFGGRDLRRFAGVVGTGMAVFGLVGLFIAVGGVSIAGFVPGWVGAAPQEHRSLSAALVLAAVATGTSIVGSNALSIAYAWQRAVVPGVIRLAAALLEVGVVVLALRGGLGVVALGLGLLCGAILSAVASIAYVSAVWVALRLEAPRISAPIGREIVRDSAPVFSTRAASIIFGNAEVTIIAVLLTAEAAAVFALTDRVFKFGAMLVNMLTAAVLPGIASLGAGRESRRVFGVLSEVFAVSAVAAAVCICLPIAVIRDFIGLWVGTAQFGGLGLAIACAAYAVVSTRVNLIGMTLTSLGEIRPAAWSSLGEVVLRVALMFALLSTIGLVGAPVSGVVSSAVIAVAAYERMLRRTLACTRSESLRIAAGGGVLVVAMFAMSSFTALLAVAPVKSWFALTVKATVIGAAGVTLILFLNSFARRTALALVRRMRGRPNG